MDICVICEEVEISSETELNNPRAESEMHVFFNSAVSFVNSVLKLFKSARWACTNVYVRARGHVLTPNSLKEDTNVHICLAIYP